MNTAEILRLAYSHMEYPLAILLAAVFIPILFLILRKEFISVKEAVEVKLQKQKTRRMMYFTRSFLIILLLIAIASPYFQTQKTIDGDPYIDLLIDNSTSMELFEDVSANLRSGLEKRTNVETMTVGTLTSSNIGDSVLGSIKPHSSVLLVSDGNANVGSDLGDVALFAAKMNATVNAIKLKPIKSDASVRITGPSKTLSNADNMFTVIITRAGDIKKVHLQVTLDNEVVFDGETYEEIIPIKKKLTEGNHQLTAKILVQDHFQQNNVFYKVIRVVPQPKILLLNEKASPLQSLLGQLYVVEPASSLPADLSPYYGIVVNDLPAGKLDRNSEAVNDFIADGNGLIVFGGENSFEKGNYKDSAFEALLPVLVGTPDKKQGDVVLAIVIDISGSQGSAFGKYESTADFSKSAIIDIIRNLKIDTRVALVAFNTQSYLLSEPSPVFAKKDLEDIVGRLKWGGGTNIAGGLLKAMQVIGSFSGSKNIVILSDGKTQNEAAAYEAARLAANSGIKIYTVGVGPTTNEKVMMDLAELTNGIYFRATDESRLKILFGPVDEKEANSGRMELVILNKNHFITENFEPNVTLYGFNQVSPKSAARLLATTSTGEPVLTVWRIGLGRVATFSVDDGSKWAGSLLGEGNSRIITRTLNWAIGDPERKSLAFIDAKDTRINEPTTITIRSKQPPTAEKIVFYKIDEDIYSGSLMPESTGFKNVAGAAFAVNYESEYDNPGINPDLESIVESTGGRMFDAADIKGIADFTKTRAKREVNERTYFRWPFIVLAISIFLLEIFIRRIIRKE